MFKKLLCKSDVLKFVFRVPNKISLNMLVKQPANKDAQATMPGALDLDLNCLVEKSLKLPEQPTDDLEKNDDVLVNIGDEPESDNITVAKENSVIKVEKVIKEPTVGEKKPKKDLKISDIFIELEHIRPGSIPPLTVLDEKNGITVTLHFAKDKPRDDVNVIVVTSVSKNELPLTNYLFQAVVPKVCFIFRVNLQDFTKQF